MCKMDLQRNDFFTKTTLTNERGDISLLLGTSKTENGNRNRAFTCLASHADLDIVSEPKHFFSYEDALTYVNKFSIKFDLKRESEI